MPFTPGQKFIGPKTAGLMALVFVPLQKMKEYALKLNVLKQKLWFPGHQISWVTE